MANLSITRRDYKKSVALATTQHHVVQLQRFHGHVLEVPDVHFHHNSAVLLPDYGHDQAPPHPADTPSNFGLSVLAGALFHAQGHPEQKTILAGHADTSGPDPHNFKLSKQRADAVLHALLGERDNWVAIAKQTGKPEDYQLILKWFASVYHWDCDPGKVDNKPGPKTNKAVRNFQISYNDAFEGELTVNGVVGPKTWGAIFDVYMDVIQNQLETDEQGLAALRGKLKWLDDGMKTIGCGEQFPIDQPRKQDYKSAINRRVEILFFDPGQEPQLTCKPCQATVCETYNPLMYDWQHIDVPPFVPKPITLCLKLVYKEPDGKTERVFPPDYPVTVRSDAGEQKVKTAAGGLVKSGIELGSSTFTLDFGSAERVYFAAAPPGSKDPKPDRLAREGDLKQLEEQDFRFFLAPPQAWSMKESDWEVVDERYNKETCEFSAPARLGASIGTEADPIKLVLNPHWHFLRFEFFDRYYGHTDHNHQRTIIPALPIDGWCGTTSTEPNARSRWTMNDADAAKAVHCMPWILQKKPDGSPDPKPVKGAQFRFQTETGAWVISESATVRKIGKVTDNSKLAPGPERLKLYDLPPLWKSKGYYCRLAPDKGEFFDNLTDAQLEESSDPAKPLGFSLDDLVVTGDNFQPYELGGDRVALFFHRFTADDGGTTDRAGLYKPMYKPGTGAGEAWAPYSKVTVNPKSYIVDYPNWTRAVFAQGNVFDCFDRRTGEGDHPIGARAAVRWVDATGKGVGVKIPTINQHPLPARVNVPANGPFFSLQPTFSQQRDQGREQCRAKDTYREWGNDVYTGDTFTIGRIDLILLRCCDWVSDNGIREVIVAVQYLRLVFEFTLPQPADRLAYQENVVHGVPYRWNRFETDDPKLPELIPVEPDKHMVRGSLVWFLQTVPDNDRAHAHVKVTQARSFMQVDGSAEFTPSGDQPDANDSYLAAHECGHGSTLLDDYNEPVKECSYTLPSFPSWVGGDPFVLDDNAMMKSNKILRPRYRWHTTEWVRSITGISFQVHEGPYYFQLPHHPYTEPGAGSKQPKFRTYVNWPLFCRTQCEAGERGKFDLFLFPLGDEPYREMLVDHKVYTGILLVVVKMRFKFEKTGVGHLYVCEWLQKIRKAIHDTFNRKFECTGTAGPHNFLNCLVQFSPRFLVETYTSDWEGYLKALGLPWPPQANTGSQYEDKVDEVEKWHPRHFLVRALETYDTNWDHDDELELKLSDPIVSQIENFFGDMVGLDLTEGGQKSVAAVQQRIVQLAIPDAVVKAI